MHIGSMEVVVVVGSGGLLLRSRVAGIGGGVGRV